MGLILIISQSRAIRNSLTEFLKFENFETHCVKDFEEATIVASKEKVSLIISQATNSDEDGYVYPWQLRQRGVKIHVLYIWYKGHEQSIEKYNEYLASIILGRPIDVPEFIASVKELYGKEYEIMNSVEVDRDAKKSSPIDIIVGESPQIEHIKEMITIVANSNARVLITGENGTGKELVAKCIHTMSKRNSMPMIEVNCLAIPHALIESEMFGHEKGSFTSANRTRKG